VAAARRRDPTLSTPQLLQRLHRLRRDFGSGAAVAKVEVLQRISRRAIRSPAQLRRLHGDLLYLRAFPDDAAVHDAVAGQLAAFHRRLVRLPGPRRRALDDSGIPGTWSRHVFAHGIARWLATRHGARAAIDWPAVTDPAALDALLARFMTRVESDAAEADGLSTRGWLRVASRDAPSDLSWLLRQLSRNVARPAESAMRAEFRQRVTQVGDYLPGFLGARSADISATLTQQRISQEKDLFRSHRKIS